MDLETQPGRSIMRRALIVVLALVLPATFGTGCGPVLQWFGIDAHPTGPPENAPPIDRPSLSYATRVTVSAYGGRNPVM